MICKISTSRAFHYWTSSRDLIIFINNSYHMLRQTKITEFYCLIPCIYIPLHRKYKTKRGLSERLLKKRLEKQGWTVWRGGLINVLKREELYPNVQRKYKKLDKILRKLVFKHHALLQYICHVHHGMPDFICYRNGEFKFVECKYSYEQLSKKQKKCIIKLQRLGFNVEVHKVVEVCTKTRSLTLNIETGDKKIIEKQMRLRKLSK